MKTRALAALLVALMILVGTGSIVRASVVEVVPVEEAVDGISPNSYWEV
ncbi:MAG: hypothetical protein DDT20_01800 [Firmicutes bacterium]|nr:hypothetical protein [Bacillota bacterium]